jgi:hypothetical protein
MPNGHLEKIEISKRIFIVFLKMKTLDYTGVPKTRRSDESNDETTIGRPRQCVGENRLSFFLIYY